MSQIPANSLPGCQRGLSPYFRPNRPAGDRLGRSRGIVAPTMVALCLLALLRAATGVAAQEAATQEDAAQQDSAQAEPAHPFPRRVPAPSLDGGVGWLNTDRPLKLADLRGKFVLLDFWTYCCINCIHVLPELKKLERAYPNELVVIGVHSAKFEGEKVTANIREAILRYEIEHPVVNDREMNIWNRYGTRSWPTLVLIDPTGQAVWLGRGEQTFENLDRLMRHGLPYYRDQGLLDGRPLRWALEREQLEASPLLFPGKLLADVEGGRLFISDSNHNRIVVTSLDGKLKTIVGSGRIGRRDGDLQSCAFDHPQGMALVGEILYVADTENHLIRAIDLARGRVTTVAGVGVQARGGWPGLQHVKTDDAGRPLELPDRWVGPPKRTAINSPWALWVHERDLYIAMAGPHQIWKMTLDGREIGPYAGNGREDIVDGPLLPRVPYENGFSSFAQPSGLASDGDWLYVADTEGSSIRAVPFDSQGRVKTLIGSSQLPGGRLFIFGDRDGQGLLQLESPRADLRQRAEATTGPLLQHAIGVTFHRGKLYVADTYNNKIKEVDPDKQTCRTLAGSGQPGHDDGPADQASFDEPAGLTAAGDKLFVADTNNHLIRVVHLDDNRVTTLAIEGLQPPDVDAEDRER